MFKIISGSVHKDGKQFAKSNIVGWKSKQVGNSYEITFDHSSIDEGIPVVMATPARIDGSGGYTAFVLDLKFNSFNVEIWDTTGTGPGDNQPVPSSFSFVAIWQ